MMDKVTRKHPQVKVVATTLRKCIRPTATPGRGGMGRRQKHVAPTCELEVYDRVGGGDGFAAGFFYGLLAAESPEEAVRLGWAHGALVTTFLATQRWHPGTSCAPLPKAARQESSGRRSASNVWTQYSLNKPLADVRIARKRRQTLPSSRKGKSQKRKTCSAPGGKLR